MSMRVCVCVCVNVLPHSPSLFLYLLDDIDDLRACEGEILRVLVIRWGVLDNPLNEHLVSERCVSVCV